ncbi:MAG TPA: hypothetical protein VFD92_07950 [Candidatus Binatia bacterium]|nr:hypothetical protein [Candidatus Binatia bacterium]
MPRRLRAAATALVCTAAVTLSSAAIGAPKATPHGVLGTPGTPRPETDPAARVEKILVARPAYAALREHDPALLHEVVDGVAKSEYWNARDEVVLAVARGRVALGVRKHLAAGNNRSIELFTRNLVAQLRVVAPQVKEACYALLATDDEGAARLATVYLADLDDSDLQYMADAINTLGPPLDEEKLERMLNGIVVVLRERFGDAVKILDHIGEPGVDHAQACQVTNALLVAILKKTGTASPGDVAPLYRYVFLKQSTHRPIAE